MRESVMPGELHPHAFFATDEEWKAIQEFLKKRRAGESADAPALPDMSAHPPLLLLRLQKRPLQRKQPHIEKNAP